VASSEGHPQTILFEVPDFALCLQLQRRLQDKWGARLVAQREDRFVAVILDPDDVRMEILLDTVARWAHEVGLLTVFFQVGEQMSVVGQVRARSDER
jgi:hypothetical protein